MSSWDDMTPADILADINGLLIEVWGLRDGVVNALPDRILVPYHYIYPAPVRFRVTGKRRKRRPSDALAREHRRQASGLSVRKSIFTA